MPSMGGSQRQRTGTRTVRARQVGQDGPRDMTGGEEGFLAQPQPWQQAANKPGATSRRPSLEDTRNFPAERAATSDPEKDKQRVQEILGRKKGRQ